MFGITYETWKSTCQMYFNLKEGSKKHYLQWFPFSKLSKDGERRICSKDFFIRYIQDASFVLFPEAMHHSENFLQKSDGSFRDSSLLSSILYLVLQAVGKEISNHYVSIRNSQIETYYAGNYQFMRAKYKQDYDDFYKSINTYISGCQFFIKTDVTSFFPNINLDMLISKIDKQCNLNEINFTAFQLSMFKELLSYCGDGRFPTVENSIASSYLSTVIYMDEIDERIFQFIDKKIDNINSFKIIRYVDDMYILINSSQDIREFHESYNQIRNEYSSILKEFGLALNTNKCCLKPSKDINDELSKSLYDEYFNGIKHDISNLFKDDFQEFLDALLRAIKTDCIDVDFYNNLISKYFGKDDIEFTPTEVFNYFIYENSQVLKNQHSIGTICELIKTDISFISLDPKRLTIMIMKTGKSEAIKALLNELFQRNRRGVWNSYDTSTAISYLIQRGFKHKDLLGVLLNNSSELKVYYDSCCRSSFLSIFENNRINYYLNIVGKDWKAIFLYFMYLMENRRCNSLAEFAFFKNYFDRFTADLECFYKLGPKHNKPNFNKFYKVGECRKFYKQIDNSESILNTAHRLRNENPMTHSSAELIDTNSTSDDLKNSIDELKMLIERFIKLQNLIDRV